MTHSIHRVGNEAGRVIPGKEIIVAASILSLFFNVRRNAVLRSTSGLISEGDWVNPTPEGRYNLVVVGGGTAGLVCAA